MQQMTYRDAQLTIPTENDPARLQIDGSEVEVTRDPESGTFSSAELPYRTFASMAELGKAVVDARHEPDAAS